MLLYGTNSPLIASLVSYSLLHFHLLSHMSAHHRHHLHYHHFHLLSLVQSFILTLALWQILSTINLLFTYRTNSTDSLTI